LKWNSNYKYNEYQYGIVNKLFMTNYHLLCTWLNKSDVAFTLSGFDDQERSPTFVKTAV